MTGRLGTMPAMDAAPSGPASVVDAGDEAPARAGAPGTGVVVPVPAPGATEEDGQGVPVGGAHAVPVRDPG